MPSQNLTSYVKKIYWEWERKNRKKKSCAHACDSLKNLDHNKSILISSSIEKTVYLNYKRNEHELISKIENLRKELSKADEKIHHVDYGAGEPSDPVDNMQAGQGRSQLLNVSRLADWTSAGAPWSDLLFNCVRETRPQLCLELGTCIGLSAAYQCAAMTLNGLGRIVTLEGGENFAKIARQNLTQLGFANFDIVVGRFEDTLQETIERNHPIDFMFNDGHHDGEAMLHYFDMMKPYFSENAVLIFDDIADYESMRVGWSKLRNDRQVGFSVDFGRMGLVCLGERPDGPVHYEAPL